MKRIHIIGAGPRTGTTLLHELMAASYDVAHVGHEASITHAFRVEKTLLTKDPGQILRTSGRLAVDNDLYVLFIIRDPRDVVCSRHKKAPDRYWSNFGLWRESALEAARLAGHARFVTIRYEDLVLDPDETQRQISEKLPFLTSKTGAAVDLFSTYMDRAAPTSGALTAMHGLRRVSADSIGRWREHLPRIAAQVAAYPDFAALLQRAGYEANDDWLDVLEGVEPDASDSFWRDDFRKRSMRQVAHRALGAFSGLRVGALRAFRDNVA